MLSAYAPSACFSFLLEIPQGFVLQASSGKEAKADSGADFAGSAPIQAQLLTGLPGHSHQSTLQFKGFSSLC